MTLARLLTSSEPAHVFRKKIFKLLSHVQLFATLWTVLNSPWNSPGQNTGVSSLPLLQGIFQTQGSNPGHLHCRQILYQLSHQGSPSENFISKYVPGQLHSETHYAASWCLSGRIFCLVLLLHWQLFTQPHSGMWSCQSSGHGAKVLVTSC